MITIIAKFVCLFLTILYGSRCIAGVCMKKGYTGGQAVLFSIGLTGFIVLQWII